MLTSSTLENWCWRIMPHVSRPAAPARPKARRVCRKAHWQGGSIDNFVGHNICQRRSRRNEPLVVCTKQVFAKFWSWPVPVMAVLFTR